MTNVKWIWNGENIVRASVFPWEEAFSTKKACKEDTIKKLRYSMNRCLNRLEETQEILRKVEKC